MHAGEKPTQVKADSEVNHQGRPEKRCSPNDPWTLTCVCGFSLTHLFLSSRCCPGSTSTSAPLPSTLEKALMNALGVQALKPRRRVNRPGKRESTASSHAAAHGEAITLLQTAHAFTQSKAHGEEGGQLPQRRMSAGPCARLNAAESSGYFVSILPSIIFPEGSCCLPFL